MQNTRNTPMGATEALTCLPPLDLVVQGEAISAAHRPWSLRCWSYLHTTPRHSSILMRLQKSDPILNMRVGVMRPAFNFEPKYRVTVLTKEEWTRGRGTPPAVKGVGARLVYKRVQDTVGRWGGGTGVGVSGHSSGRRPSICLGKYPTVFQAEIHAI